MRILVVEDENDLADAVAAGLRREGYAVDVAGDGRSALERLDVNAYDMVCLDLGLPDVDGLDICHHVVNGGADPAVAVDAAPPRILVLSARDQVEDRIAGLDHGADDYLVKPFALGELTARVRALMRRDVAGGGPILRWGDIELDAARHQVTVDGRVVELTPKEFALLRFFLIHPDEVHSAERLLEHVWDEHADPFTNTVRVTISNLRRKLGAAGADQALETVTGRGYRLAGAA
jgi:DNA-binding response OmpR family regulator